MKRIISLILVLVMVLSLSLTGCGKKDVSDNSSSDTQTTSTETTKENAADNKDSDKIFPLKEKVTLTALVHTRPNVDNYEDNDMTKWIEGMTNLNLDFIVSTEKEAQEKLNLLLATGDYPDMILVSQLNSAQQSLYGSQGILLPLNDLIDKYGENTKILFEEVPLAKERVTMPDGNIYNLPRVNQCYHCQATQKMWIYKPWLDKLGLTMPETTEDYYNVLKAFKEQDPNGNGKSDEIPLAGWNKGWETYVEAFLMNSFVYYAKNQSGAERLFVDNGKIAASYLTEGYKDGLKYLQMLRKEGLLAKESFTQDGSGLKQMGENPDAVILGTFAGGAPGTATDLSGDRWRDYVTVPPLKGPDGTRFVKYDPFSAISPGFSITDKCEYPEIAFALGDLLYNQEVSLSNSVGRMDTDWTYIDDDSKKGINGEKAVWNELIPLAKQEPNGFWNQMGNTYRPSWQRLGRYNEDPNNVEVVLYNETKKNYEPYFPSTDMLFPPLILTEDQSAELLSYSTTINDYVLQNLAEFILTDIDIEKAWNSYTDELEAMGVKKMLAIYQEAYDSQK